MPPEYLWCDADGLEQWWASVEAKRNDGYPSVSDDDHADDGMEQNDLARYLKG